MQVIIYFILTFNTRFFFLLSRIPKLTLQLEEYIYKFEKELFEGDVYLMSKFSVVANMGEYRSTRHFFKLNFQLGTKVTFSGSVPFNVFPFTHPAYCFGKNFQAICLVSNFALIAVSLFFLLKIHVTSYS